MLRLWCDSALPAGIASQPGPCGWGSPSAATLQVSCLGQRGPFPPWRPGPVCAYLGHPLWILALKHGAQTVFCHQTLLSPRLTCDQLVPQQQQGSLLEQLLPTFLHLPKALPWGSCLVVSPLPKPGSTFG